MEGSHAKVGNFDLEVGGNENVFGLEITVADVERVAVGDCAYHLAEKEYGHLFRQTALCVDKGKEVALVDVFENQIAGDWVSGGQEGRYWSEEIWGRGEDGV